MTTARAKSSRSATHLISSIDEGTDATAEAARVQGTPRSSIIIISSSSSIVVVAVLVKPFWLNTLPAMSMIFLT